MSITVRFRKLMAWCLVCGCLSSSLHAAQPVTARTDSGIAVVAAIENVASGPRGRVQGAILSESGSPIAGTDVVIGQQGRVLHVLRTDAEGRFEAPLTPGVYQVASYAKVQNYRVWSDRAPTDAKQGIVHVMPGDVARGQTMPPPPDQPPYGYPGNPHASDPIPSSYGPAYGNPPPVNPHHPLLNAIINPLLIAGVIAGVVAIAEVTADDDGS